VSAMGDKAERRLEGHRQRLRQKFLDHGLDKLTDDEIVELLLTIATPRRDCKQAARDALAQMGGLAKVLEASVEELTRINGIGPTNAMGITMIQQVARKFLRERLMRADYLDSFSDALDYFTHAMKEARAETAHVLYLSSQNAILAEDRFGSSSPGSVEINPRQVIQSAYKHSAAGVVMAHNHPGGDSKPSPDDIRVTANLYFALRFAGLWLRDHLVVTSQSHFSFMKEGLISSFEKKYENTQKALWK